MARLREIGNMYSRECDTRVTFVNKIQTARIMFPT